MPTTGSKCQTSGIYRGDCTCGKEIALSKGETFPVWSKYSNAQRVSSLHLFKGRLNPSCA